jgi:hypothetical protein
MSSFWSRLLAGEKPAEKHAGLLAKIAETRNYWHCKKLEDFEGGAAIDALPPREKCEFALALCRTLKADGADWTGSRFLALLLKQKLPFKGPEILYLLEWHQTRSSNYFRNISEMIRILERHFRENPPTDELKQSICAFADSIARDYPTADARRKAVRLRDLAGVSVVANPLVPGEAWSDAAIAEIASLPDGEKALWCEILHRCQSSTGGSPTAKWLKTAAPLVEKIRHRQFKARLLGWFPLVDRPRTAPIAAWSPWMPDPNLMLADANADILKGLVWLCALREDREIARALTALALSAYKKLPLIGPRCVRVGNACVWALGQMNLEGVGQLAILKLRAKFGTAQKGIDQALSEAARKIGLPADELEEMSVPSYGLTEVGAGRENVGGGEAELIVAGTNAAELRWFGPDGKPRKSAPKAVRENHAAKLKELNLAVRDIKKMLPAQRDRIENFYLAGKRLAYRRWRERYLDHPLVGTLARRLIWRFDESTTGIFLDGKLVDRDGRELTLFDDSNVELWHPLHSATEETLGWRAFLENQEIRQPFKQAHREIYVLTDAERETNVYSNRFAAHIIKQHQFNALCSQRGWKNQLRIMADADFHAPLKNIAPAGLRAEFRVEAVGDEFGVDSNETGVYYYLATDQVRFYPAGAPLNYGHGYGGGYAAEGRARRAVEPVPLDCIPPLVFSETMRDVDLFVGVGSIGNDPNWTDNGRERHQDYWYGYAFGDLSATAKTRRAVLEKLFPRLKIAAQSRFEDKFLVIEGSRRTYRIHLGSGNVLMSPNDQYLCIVPSPSAERLGDGRFYLPFEGDRTLSIILSKAFMLAADAKISDPLIRRQIDGAF